jgi:hypothetical protein
MNTLQKACMWFNAFFFDSYHNYNAYKTTE